MLAGCEFGAPVRGLKLGVPLSRDSCPVVAAVILRCLRAQGFSDLVEGTVYALLVRIEQRGLVEVEKVPSLKGPSRKVYTLNEQGYQRLQEFWSAWDFLAQQIESLRTGDKRPAVERQADASHDRGE